MDFTKRMRPLSPEEKKKVDDNLGLVGHLIDRKFPWLKERPDERRKGQRPGEHRMFTYRDIFNVGVFGLIECLDKWEPHRAAFTTAAEVWIENRIRLFLAENRYQIRIPKWMRHKKTHSSKEERNLERIKHPMPVDEAIDAMAPHKSARVLKRKALRLLYTVEVEDDKERAGRMIAVMLGGLDGGTGAREQLTPEDQAKDVNRIADEIGMDHKEATEAYELFMEKVREAWRSGAKLRPKPGT